MRDRATRRPRARPTTAASVLVLLLLPALLLWPALVSDQVYLPYDLAQFPPASTLLTPDQVATITARQNMDVTEVPSVFVPELRFAQQELAERRLPQWNPYARAGAPLLATSVVGLLYPPNWPTLLLGDPVRGLALGAWLSFALAGLLTYGLLRELGLRQPAALFGAILFALGGTMHVNGHFYQRIAALAWLPGQLWAILRLSHREGHGRVPSFAALAIATGMSWLAGFPPYAAAGTFTAAAFALLLAAADLRRDGWRDGRRRALRSLALAGAGLALGVAVAAVQLVPMLAFFPESSRALRPTLDAASAQTFSAMGLLGFLLPDPFGHPQITSRLPYELSPLAWQLYSVDAWQSGIPLEPNYNYTEYTVFAGTAALLLVPAALLLQGSRLRLGLGLLALLLLLLAIAPKPIAYLYALPGFASVPPSRFVGPLALLVAMLAAIGLERIVDGWNRRVWLALLATGGALLLLLLGWLAFGAATPQEWLDRIAPGLVERYRPKQPDASPEMVRSLLGPYAAAGHLQLRANLRYGAIAVAVAVAWLALLPLVRQRRTWRKLWLLGAAAGTLVQLFPLARAVNVTRALPFGTDTAIHEFLRERRDAARAGGGFTVARATALPASLPIALPPCTLVPERIRDLNIYTFVDGRSHAPFLQMVRNGLLSEANLVRGNWIGALPDRPEVLGHPYLDLIGVRYLLTTDRLQHAGPPTNAQLRGPGGEFYVHERGGALPRAFAVPALRELPDDAAVLAALASPDLAPSAAVLITPDQAQRLGAALAAPAALPDRELRFIAETPLELTIAFAPGPPCYLVLADPWLGGWTASINGEPAPIARGNHWMRVLRLPARGGEARFRYRTPGLTTGLLVSAGALIALLLLMLSYLTTKPRA